MDIYTTSFCLPRSAAHSADLTTSTTTSPSTSFDYGPRDGSSGFAGPGGDAAQGQNQRNPSSNGSHPADAPVGNASSGAGGVGGGDGTNAEKSSNGTRNGSTTAEANSNGALANKRGSVDLNDVMQRLCVDTMAAHQCIVSFSPVDPPSSTSPNLSNGPESGAAHDKASSSTHKMYNFHLSGGYQQVMSARGSILRENPFKVRSPQPFPRL